jgi:hypothetical protein
LPVSPSPFLEKRRNSASRFRSGNEPSMGKIRVYQIRQAAERPTKRRLVSSRFHGVDVKSKLSTLDEFPRRQVPASGRFSLSKDSPAAPKTEGAPKAPRAPAWRHPRRNHPSRWQPQIGAGPETDAGR